MHLLSFYFKEQIFFLICILAFLPAEAFMPNKYNWSKIETEHFDIIHTDEHSQLAQSAAHKAEQAAAALKNLTHKFPKKTLLIIDPSKQSANGSATFFPYPTITIQPSNPSPSSSIGQYNDWLYELLVHEYTHILSFYDARGIYRPLRWLMGTAVAPGYFMPLWYLEGLAVLTESIYTSGGRLKSSRYQAYRKNLKRNNIAFANEQDTGLFPHGGAPYIYGGWLSHIATDTKESKQKNQFEAAKSLHKTFSLRLPYFVNSGFKASTHISAHKAWCKSFKTNQALTAPKEALLGQKPFYDLKSQSLYYIGLGNFLEKQFIQKQDNQKEKVLFEFPEILNFKVTDEFVYFLSPDLENQDQEFFNLRSYSFKTKKIKKLTQGLKGSDFDVFEDQILFTESFVDHSQISLANLSSPNERKTILKSNIEERFALPRFKNKNEFLYSFKAPNQPEEILNHNLSNATQTSLLKKAHINYISRSPDSVVLYEESGVKKAVFLNKANKKDNAFQTFQGLESIEPIGQDEFYISRQSQKGPYILKQKKTELTSDYTPTEIHHQETPAVTSLSYKTKPYSSWSKLRPHYIVPNYVSSPYGFGGEHLFGLSTGGKDPLGLNNYSLNFFTDTLTKKSSFNFNYTSRHFRMPIFFSAGSESRPLNLDVYTTSQSLSLGSHYNFKFSYGRNLRLSYGGLWNKTEINTSIGSIKRAGLNLSLNYKNYRLQPRELAPKSGWSTGLSSQYYIPMDKKTYADYLKVSYGIKFYKKSPLFSKHRIVLGLDASWTDKSLPIIFSSNSQNLPYKSAAYGSFLMRGLPTGSILSTNWFGGAHLDYRFPIANINWGPGLWPGFFNRITGALTADYGLAKGLDYIHRLYIDKNTKLYSAGAELVFEGKVFYHLPASLHIGYYKFLNKDFYNGDPEVYIGLGVRGLP